MLLLSLLVACGGGSTPAHVGSAPVIASFGASPSWITTGQSATLNWSVSGATSLSIDAVGSVSGGSVQVSPTADATYVLTATNESGSTQMQVTLAVFRPPTVWFAPMPPAFAPNYGAYDFLLLFNANSPWNNAAEHVTVFKIYPQIVDYGFDDASLRNLFADLKRRHISLAMEWGPLDPDNCGEGEGFAGNDGLRYAQRIRDLGGFLQYIAFDEPFEFGSYLISGPKTCQWSPQQVAHNAALHVAQIRTIFPDVIVGDIEVVPNGGATDRWLSAYQQWLDAWQAETGRPLAFFHFDVDWAGDWKPPVAALARALRARRIPVGQIYIGAGDAASDEAWVASAEQRANDVETIVGLKPDQVIFQSWLPLPHHVLPETDPGAHTYLINRYFRERTRLTLSALPNAVQGQLMDANGPLSRASVSLAATPSSGTGQVTTYQLSGTVPAGTKYVVFGARVGMEGCDAGGAQPVEFLLTDFALDTSNAGRLALDFASGLSPTWGISGTATTPQVEGASLHVKVAPDQALGLNSAMSLPFTAAGSPYTFTLHATIPLGAVGGGCAIAVFQDATPAEITRAVIPIVPIPFDLGPVQTDANGIYAVLFPPLPAGTTVSAQYAGSDALWPAAASLVTGQQAVPAIATASLPDGSVGSAYSQALGVTGGVAPYLWVAGQLPPGLSLRQDGLLSGTPTAAGNYSVVLSVVDHAASPQAADVSLEIVIH